MAYESRKLELRDKKRNWRSTASTGTEVEDYKHCRNKGQILYCKSKPTTYKIHMGSSNILMGATD
jgi:hypothetical protein